MGFLDTLPVDDSIRHLPLAGGNGTDLAKSIEWGGPCRPPRSYAPADRREDVPAKSWNRLGNTASVGPVLWSKPVGCSVGVDGCVRKEPKNLDSFSHFPDITSDDMVSFVVGLHVG